MRIGLVSAHKHCKSHIRALALDGYDVTCLGARPTTIPPSYDVLVVRVASISHGGEATARSWMRDTGKPAIYEDGLTGIRRELKRLVLDDAVPQRDTTPEKVCCSDIRDDLAACAEAYVEARPDDSKDSLSRALRSVLYEKYPDQADLCLSIIPAIVAVHYNSAESAMNPAFKVPVYPTPRGPLPDQKWTQTYSVNRMREVYDHTSKMVDNMPPDACGAFMDIYGQCVEDTSLDFRTLLWESVIARPSFFLKGGKTIFDGNPMGFVMFTMMQSPPEEAMRKRSFFIAYKSLTSRGSDTRMADAVSWFLGHPEPLNAPNPVGARIEEAPPAPKPTASVDAVDSNTEAILTLMDDFSRLKSEVSTLDACIKGDGLISDGVLQSLEARIKALEDFRNTQGPVGSDWKARIEGQIKALDDRVTQVRLDQIPDSGIERRIKALEDAESARLSGDDVSLMAGLEARKAVEAMGEELRGDISNAFDALAAEAQAASNPASNPLAALEQVKAALKAAGFTGTLTLTIE